MIKSKKDYFYYLNADRVALGIKKPKGIKETLKYWCFPNYIWEYQKALRKVEYYKNCKKSAPASLFFYFAFRRYRDLSIKLGITIPPNVVGPGLAIAHIGNIVINGGAQIGANCRIHVGVNIGTQAGYSNKAPRIGNNCYIGPGAKMFGPIEIADGIAIGANSVVNKSFTENNVAIAGVPAKIIDSTNTKELLIPATDLI